MKTLADCFGAAAGPDDAVDEIVDVGEVIENVTATDHHEAAAADRPEELQEAAIAGPVDTDRPHDG